MNKVSSLKSVVCICHSFEKKKKIRPAEEVKSRRQSFLRSSLTDQANILENIAKVSVAPDVVFQTVQTVLHVCLCGCDIPSVS